jgi:BD-FAE protein
MSIFNTGKSIRKTTKKLVPFVGLMTLAAAQNTAAVNLIDPADYDWDWKAWPVADRPDFPNECYGEGDDCLVDTDDNEFGKSNEGDNKLFDVWIPDGPGPYPVYIYAHGGSFTGGTKERMNLAGPLLKAGNVVFVDTNYLLNGKENGEVENSINDVLELIDYLKENKDTYKINPEQIFVGGGSAGGVIFNDIVYNQKASGIRGLWNWNVFMQEGQSVNLTDEQLLANADIPVVNAHPDPYPTDKSHSAKLGFEHSEANWAAGSTGIFIHAIREHESTFGYGSYDFIDQIWENGVWIKDYRFGIDTGARIPNLAEWIYDNIPEGPGPGTKLDFYDDYSNDDLFNSAYGVVNGTWFVRSAGTLDSNDKTVTGRAIVEETIGDNFTASVTVKTVSKSDEASTFQVPRLMFCYTSSGSFYEAYVKSDGRVTLDKTVGDEKFNIGVVQLQGYDDSTRNSLKVYKDGSSIEVYVNEQLYISVQDSSLSGGNVGLRSMKNHARFDNLRIMEY